MSASTWTCSCRQVNWETRGTCRACGKAWQPKPKAEHRGRNKGRSKRRKDTANMATRAQSNLYDAMHTAAANRNAE
eukprot:3997487-Alexandrium_andersonii.AAC.1